jgi:predicted PurR-regulated permease PerM
MQYFTGDREQSRVRVTADDDKDMIRDRSEFALRVFMGVGVALGVVALALAFWYTIDILLLFFASILLATFFRALSRLICERTPLSMRASLTLVLLTFLALIIGGGWFMAPDIAAELDQLRVTIPASVEQIESWLRQYAWGAALLDEMPEPSALISGRAGILQQVTGIFSTTVVVLANFVIMLSLAIYLAAKPDTYVNGFIQLVPHGKRARAKEIVDTLAVTMQRWILGRAASMLLVGLLITLGLWFLNVPLALTLGIIAGIFTFIPYLGPIIGWVPAALVGLMQGPQTAIYVTILYTAVEQLESFVFVPIAQEVAVKVPPGLTIMSQVILGVLFGKLGLILATPLTAVGMVLVKMLYVEDMLGDPVEIPGYDGEGGTDSEVSKPDSREETHQKRSSA